LGFDRQGWITVFAALLLALITLFTSYTHVDLLGAASVELKVQRYELEQRKLQMRKEDEQRRQEDERLRKLDERFEELSSKLCAILSSSGTSSTPPSATQGESEM